MLTGCGDAKSKVKESQVVTENNKSVTLVKVFEEYKYFKSVKWSGDEKRVIVECEIDLEKDPSPELKTLAKSLIATFEFDANTKKPLLLRGKLVKPSGEIKSKEMPTSPQWMEPERIVKDVIYPNKPFSDISSQIAYQ